MVHGGEKFACSTLLTEEVLKTVESCNDLAPLHNPPTLVGVAACKELLPTTPMVGVFDTAFQLTSMLLPMSTMRNTLFVVTASTEHLINMFL